MWAFVHEANTGKIDGNNLRLLESEEYDNEFGLMMMEGQMDRLNPYGMMTEGQMDRELEASNRCMYLRATGCLGWIGDILKSYCRFVFWYQACFPIIFMVKNVYILIFTI